MGYFARGREIFAIIAMRIASIRIGSTQYQDRLIVEYRRAPVILSRVGVSDNTAKT